MATKPTLALSCLVAVGLCAASVRTQDFVKNGDFSQGLAGWTTSGYGIAPRVESYDVEGLGVTACFAVNAGGKTSPPPYAPYVLEQKVVVARGLGYTFHAQVAAARSILTANGDAGTFEAWVGNQRLDRVAFGQIWPPEVKRARLCARFVAATSGLTTLRITIHRNFLATSNTPRCYVDDVSLRLARDPVLCLREDRKLGARVRVDVLGTAQAVVAFYVSPARLAQALNVPGFSGSLALDPARMVFLFSAQLGPTGLLLLPTTLPATPALHAVPVWVQGIQASAKGLSIGPEERLGLHR